MADPSSPLSPPPRTPNLDSSPNGRTSRTLSSGDTPEPKSDTDSDFTPDAQEEVDIVSHPSETQDAEDEEHVVEEKQPVKKRKTTAKKLKGGPKDLYPEGLSRMTRLGKNTYGMNTGPLSDDTDWDGVAFAVIREQLTMRGVDSQGTKDILLPRIKDWRSWVEKDPAYKLELEHTPAFTYTPAEEDSEPSATARGRKQKNNSINPKTVAASDKIKGELMYLLGRSDVSWDVDFGGNNTNIESATFSILSNSSSQYDVVIGKSHKCDCIAKKYNPGGHCKHILYVLIYILRAPGAVIEQQKLDAQTVNLVLQHGFDVRPTKAQVDADPTMRDGIPKDCKGIACPFCFKPMDGQSVVACTKCGRHTHNSCFSLWASKSHWGVKCLVCQSPWTEMAPAGQ